MKVTVGQRVITPTGKHARVEAIGYSVCVLCDGEAHPCYFDASELKPEESSTKEDAESKAVQPPAPKKRATSVKKTPAKKSAKVAPKKSAKKKG